MAETNKRRRLSDSGSFKSDEEVQNDVEMDLKNEPELAPKESQKRTLFVRSLPTSATTENLTEYFSQSYPLKHATVVLDPQTKESKGYGFVTFTDHEDAKRALEELNGSVFNGKKIKIDIAEPRHRGEDDAGKSAQYTKLSQLKEMREKKKQDAQPPKLIIRNLPWSISEPEHLTLLFRSFGKIKHATVPKKGTRHAGFGFIVMRGRKNAERAMEAVNGKEVDGRTLAVDWAVDKTMWEGANAAADGADGEQKPVQGEEDGSASGKPDAEGGEAEDEDEELSDADAENEDESMADAEEEEDDGEEEVEDERNASTIFIRNLPFSATDEDLHEQFSQFGSVRYARVVYDMETERPRGTAFVCFWKPDDAMSCLRDAPKQLDAQHGRDSKEKGAIKHKHSILEDEHNDPTGKYTMDGRVLQLSQAVSRKTAGKLQAEGSTRREARDTDKRRLYLLSEGTISAGSSLYSKLSPTEVKMREASAKQRQKLVKENPMLHLSLTRLSVRNIPRHIDSKALKALAREAVVGFAKDVKAGVRQPLSKEELIRSAEAMKEAEKLRKVKGKGIVRQSKVVFEGRDGSKIGEDTGAGRSRGYGFIEYTTHRTALMGLRWLNGHAVDSSSPDINAEDKRKRMIVEFAIENAQVVSRRQENELKSRREPSGSKPTNESDKASGFRKKPTDGFNKAQGFKNKFPGQSDRGSNYRNRSTGQSDRSSGFGNKPQGVKRKWSGSDRGDRGDKEASKPKPDNTKPEEKDNQTAKRNRIIAKKRMMRRTRKSG